MAKITAMVETEIYDKIGMSILKDYFTDDGYDCIDVDENIYFSDLDIENTIIFLEELKKQLIHGIDDIIKKI